MGGLARGVEISGAVRWSEADARRVLDAWRRSGRSAYAYAREHGMNAQRLLWWRKRLGEWEHEGRAPRRSARVRLVPAVLAADPRAPAAVVRLGAHVTVEISEVSSVPASWVASLARELARDECS